MKNSSVLLIPSAIALGLASCKPKENPAPAAAEPAKEAPAAAAKPASVPAKKITPELPKDQADEDGEAADPNTPSLKAGSEVRVESLASATWVQGGPLTAFEPGKVYIFECWATWCGPCVAAIPHVNDLHKRYAEKGLRVYGINVWEDGLEKVTEFVKRKGEGMSYPVAYTGKDSAFEKEWLKPAGVKGIPHAFVVRDGKLIMTTHPMQLTDQVVEALLSGEEGARKAAADIQSAQESRERLNSIIRTFRTAAASGNTALMNEKLGELEKSAPDSPYIASMKLDVLIADKNWNAASKALEEMPDGPSRQMSIQMTANKVCLQGNQEFPAEFVKTLASGFEKQLAATESTRNPMSFVMLSALQGKAGDKDASLANAKKAVETAKQVKSANPLPIEPFERYAKGLEAGENPSVLDVSKWIREAMAKSAAPAPDAPAAAPAPAKP